MKVKNKICEWRPMARLLQRPELIIIEAGARVNESISNPGRSVCLEEAELCVRPSVFAKANARLS